MRSESESDSLIALPSSCISSFSRSSKVQNLSFKAIFRIYLFDAATKYPVQSRALAVPLLYRLSRPGGLASPTDTMEVVVVRPPNGKKIPRVCPSRDYPTPTYALEPGHWICVHLSR